MSWLNEHSLRFLFPADRNETEQVGEGDIVVSRFKPRGLELQPPNFSPADILELLVHGRQWVHLGRGDPHSKANSVPKEVPLASCAPASIIE
jgi:hypothetical protein